MTGIPLAGAAAASVAATGSWSQPGMTAPEVIRPDRSTISGTPTPTPVTGRPARAASSVVRAAMSASTASPPRSRPVAITSRSSKLSDAASTSPSAVLVPPTSTPIATSPGRRSSAAGSREVSRSVIR
jgi:hypothetical protein